MLKGRASEKNSNCFSGLRAIREQDYYASSLIGRVCQLFRGGGGRKRWVCGREGKRGRKREGTINRLVLIGWARGGGGADGVSVRSRGKVRMQAMNERGEKGIVYEVGCQGASFCD